MTSPRLSLVLMLWLKRVFQSALSESCKHTDSVAETGFECLNVGTLRGILGLPMEVSAVLSSRPCLHAVLRVGREQHMVVLLCQDPTHCTS